MVFKGLNRCWKYFDNQCHRYKRGAPVQAGAPSCVKSLRRHACPRTDAPAGLRRFICLPGQGTGLPESVDRSAYTADALDQANQCTGSVQATGAPVRRAGRQLLDTADALDQANQCIKY